MGLRTALHHHGAGRKPGNKIEIAAPDLQEGQDVTVRERRVW